MCRTHDLSGRWVEKDSKGALHQWLLFNPSGSQDGSLQEVGVLPIPNPSESSVEYPDPISLLGKTTVASPPQQRVGLTHPKNQRYQATASQGWNVPRVTRPPGWGRMGALRLQKRVFTTLWAGPYLTLNLMGRKLLFFASSFTPFNSAHVEVSARYDWVFNTTPVLDSISQSPLFTRESRLRPQSFSRQQGLARI